MELLAASLIAQVVIPLVGAVIAGAAAYGIKLLKDKIQFEEGKQALDALDQIVQATVGNIGQTVKKDILHESKKAKLSGAQALDLKKLAFNRIKAVASSELQKAAVKMVDDLDGYVNQKIEDSVLRLKAPQ